MENFQNNNIRIMETEKSRNNMKNASQSSLMKNDLMFADIENFHRNFFERQDQMFGGIMSRFSGNGQDSYFQTSANQMFEGITQPFTGFDDILGRFDRIEPSDFEGELPKGNSVSQTFVSSQKMGPDGKMHKEDYFKTNVSGVTSNGQRIGQVEEMYNNSGNGVNKMAQQKILNNQAYKAVKSKMGDGKASINNRP